MDFFSTIPTWFVLVGGAVIGILVILGIFDREKNTRNKEKETLEDRVRKLYQEESKVLQDKVDVLTKQVDALRTENEIITKIFQGRDGNTTEFQKQGFEVMRQFAATNQLVAETHKIALENRNGLHNLAKNMEKLIKTLEKHLTTESKKPILSLPQGTEINVKKTN